MNQGNGLEWLPAHEVGEVLTVPMQNDLFQPFSLVGGTSLSLQFGHRMSDDIDLFTDHHYESINFGTIDNF